MGIINKITFLLKRPSVVFVVGKGCDLASEAILCLLGERARKVSEIRMPWTKSRKEVIVFAETKIKKEERSVVSFLLKNSKRPILVLTHTGNIPPEKESFTGDKVEGSKEIASSVKEKGRVFLNFDDEAVREIKDYAKAQVVTFGFQKRADFRVSDINVDLEGTNFKINYQNYTIPFWLEGVFGKEQIYAAAVAAAVALSEGMNLVNVSQSLRNYKSLPGKMRMIKGIKKSWIIDNTKDAHLSSMREALSLLSRIGKEKRKVAVLGDVLNSERDPAFVHEEIGREAAKSCDLLFTIGARAKFLAKGAKENGMEKVYHYYDPDQAKKEIQEKMKEGDVVLVDASKEVPMEKVLEEIKFIKL